MRAPRHRELLVAPPTSSTDQRRCDGGRSPHHQGRPPAHEFSPSGPHTVCWWPYGSLDLAALNKRYVSTGWQRPPPSGGFVGPRGEREPARLVDQVGDQALVI